MAIYEYSFGENTQMVNGKVVGDTAVKAEYNGKTLHIDKRDNNKFMHYTLDNKDLKKLMKKKTSKLGLLERLSAEYVDKHRQTRKKKGKSKGKGKSKSKSKSKSKPKRF